MTDIEFKIHARLVARTLQERHGDGPAHDALTLLVGHVEDVCRGYRKCNVSKIAYALGKIVTDPSEDETMIAVLASMEHVCAGRTIEARFFLAQAAIRLGLPPEPLPYDYSLLVYVFKDGAYVVGHGDNFETDLQGLAAQYGLPLRIARCARDQHLVPRSPIEQA